MSDQKTSPPSDPNDKLGKEIAHLNELEKKPFLERSFGYMKMTGPGLLQSAMTLGAGSAAASVLAGASFGYKLLWVQPVAMFFGVMMFAAISNIVLTTKERPYGGFKRELGSIWDGLRYLVILWAVGTIMASVIWHFPQYGLAAGAARSVVKQFSPTKEPVTNDTVIMGDFRKVDEEHKAEIVDSWKLIKDEKIEKRSWFGLGAVELDKKTGKPIMVDQFTPFGYSVNFALGFAILLINIIVVFNYGRGGVGIRIYEWFLRAMIALVILTFLMVVILNFKNIQWGEVFRGFTAQHGIPLNDDPVERAKTITMVLGMLGAAVGINMTFLYPYSLLKKGWGKEHKTLVKWDLGLTMFLPFVLVTSLIIIGMTVSGVYNPDMVKGDLVQDQIKPLAAAAALKTDLINESLATVIFCGGLIGMTCGAISAHMTCCGFTMCEMLGFEHTTKRFRLFALTPSIGLLGVVIELPFWFPVAASAVCFTMLPIAYLIFLIMNNRRSYIGDAVGKGPKRAIFNIILVAALCLATIGAIISVKLKVFDELKKQFSSVEKPTVVAPGPEKTDVPVSPVTELEKAE